MNPRVLVHAGRRAAELALAGMVIFSCAVLTTQYSPDVHGEEPQRQVHITDRYGERFDITHAVERYHMHRRGFEFGIGKNTIRPLNQPGMLTEEDRGYPAYGSVWNRGPDVIGAVIEGEARSYPVDRLVRHEIVNESVGATEAAVTY